MFNVAIVQGVFLLVRKSHAYVFGLKLNWFLIVDKGKDLDNQFSLNPNTQKWRLGTSQKNTLCVISQWPRLDVWMNMISEQKKVKQPLHRNTDGEVDWTSLQAHPQLWEKIFEEYSENVEYSESV